MIKENKIINFDKNKLTQLEPILKKYQSLLAIIFFGSRATKHYTDLSDIDLFYLSSAPLTLMEESEVLYSITSFLLTQEIDFTNVRKLGIKEQYDILTQGQLVYCSDREKFLDCKERIMSDYFDFKHISSEYLECFQKNLKSGEIFKS